MWKLVLQTLSIVYVVVFLTVSFMVMLPFFLVVRIVGGGSAARRYVAFPAGGWVVYPMLTTLAEAWGHSKTHLHVEGREGLVAGESALVLANHVCAFDWFSVMRLGVRTQSAGWLVILAKESIRYIPVVGWAVAMAGVMLRRSWDLDSTRLYRAFRSAGSAQQPVWLMIHPEGTRMCPEKLEASQAWLAEKGKAQMEHVLAPRVKAVVAALSALHDRFAAVYDVTLAYPDGFPTLFNIAGRDAPPAHIHVDRIPIQDVLGFVADQIGADVDDVPALFTATADGDADAAARVLPALKAWLYGRWELKEQRLLDFYRRGGGFGDEGRVEDGVWDHPGMGEHLAYVGRGFFPDH